MKIKLLAIGKTDSKELERLIGDYENRLKRYLPFELVIIPDIKRTKNLSEGEQKRKEAEAVLNKIVDGDTVILLDEHGKEYNSLGFAKYLQQYMNSGLKQLVLVIGGPYGFDPLLERKAKAKWSLSKLTFSHQMVRLFAVEQLYRAMTILRNQPYHHR